VNALNELVSALSCVKAVFPSFPVANWLLINFTTGLKNEKKKGSSAEVTDFRSCTRAVVGAE